MGNFGFTELVLIFVIVLLVFGAKRLPEVARSMGKAVNEFKKAKSDIMSDLENADRQTKREAGITQFNEETSEKKSDSEQEKILA